MTPPLLLSMGIKGFGRQSSQPFFVMSGETVHSATSAALPEAAFISRPFYSARDHLEPPRSALPSRGIVYLGDDVVLLVLRLPPQPLGLVLEAGVVREVAAEAKPEKIMRTIDMTCLPRNWKPILLKEIQSTSLT